MAVSISGLTKKNFLFLLYFVSLWHDSVLFEIPLKRSQSLIEVDEQVAQQISDFSSLQGAFRSEKNNISISTLMMTRYIYDSTYHLGMNVGTPPDEYQFIIDTSKSETWLTSEHCRNEHEHFCQSRRGYRYTLSRTHQKLYRVFELEYGAVGDHNISRYGKVRGRVASDTFQFGEYQVQNFQFGVADQFEGEFFDESSVWDGSLGLAKDTNIRHDLPLFMNELVKQNPIDLANFTSFTLYFSKFGSESPTMATGLFGYSNVDKDKWQLRMATAKCLPGPLWKILFTIRERNTIFCEQCTGIIDTTYNYIAGPKERIDHIVSYIEAIEFGNMYSVDCNKISNLTAINVAIDFEFFEFKPEDYIIKTNVEKGRQLCVTAFVSENPYPEESDLDLFTLGISFIRRFYTVFSPNEDPATIRFMEPSST